MLVFIKLGGSLITDKNIESSFREDVMQRLANEIVRAMQKSSELQLIIGHGSGSFGHFIAKKHNTADGVSTDEQWRGMGEVATIAARLNYLVTNSLYRAGAPIFRIQPSASAIARDGQLIEMALRPIEEVIKHNVIPLVYGDVSIDEIRGGTIISTETILSYLARHLPIKQVLLLGETEGVYDLEGNIIPEITPQNITQVEQSLGGSGGTDVTGGMRSKVLEMLTLAKSFPDLTIRIMDGRLPHLLYEFLTAKNHPVTLITAK
jgi:isopentenyl phosphate kinase